MVAVKSHRKIQYKCEADTTEPLVLFDLDGIGINSRYFLSELEPSFESLEWDTYDVRREQLSVLQSVVDVPTQLALDYYRGTASWDHLIANVTGVPSEVITHMQDVRPYRRRSTSRFELAVGGESWACKRIGEQGDFSTGSGDGLSIDSSAFSRDIRRSRRAPGLSRAVATHR